MRRREQLLDAALEVLAAAGAASLRTTEVAKRCGAPVASLYQYFPTRQALLMALAERELGERSARLRAIIPDSPRAMWLALEAELRSYVRSGLDPAVRELLFAMQADPDLRRLDAVDTAANARLLADQMAGVGRPSADLVRRLTLVIELAGALALRLPAVASRERNAVVDDFVAMVRSLLRPTD